MDLQGIDLNLLVAFDALMAERSVTKAAKRIGRTQPAMSAALGRLRILFRDDLFVRGKGQLQPTPRASELAKPLGRALREISESLRFAQGFDPATSDLTINVAMQEHAAFKLVSDLIVLLGNRAPSLKMNVVIYLARDDAINLLDSGEADVAIGVPTRSAPGRIFSQRLFDEEYMCILRKDHPAAQAPLDVETFLSLRHVLASPEGDQFGHTDDVLSKVGCERSLGVTITQMYPIPRIVARSDMIATLMRGVIETSEFRNRLAVLQSPVPLDPCTYVMSWHLRNDAHPAQRWFRTCVENVASTSR